jgi:hypothetical protein
VHSYQESEVVDLVVVTQHNRLWVGRMTRLEASDQMRAWYVARDRIYKKGEGWEDAKQFLDHGTLAINCWVGGNPEAEKTMCMLTVAWKHVIGMYIQDIKTPSESYFEKAGKLMDKELKDRERGDEWKKEEDE